TCKHSSCRKSTDLKHVLQRNRSTDLQDTRPPFPVCFKKTEMLQVRAEINRTEYIDPHHNCHQAPVNQRGISYPTDTHRCHTEHPFYENNGQYNVQHISPDRDIHRLPGKPQPLRKLLKRIEHHQGKDRKAQDKEIGFGCCNYTGYLAALDRQ